MDPISLEVIYNATVQIVHELTINMAKTGYSIIIRELQDVTFAVLDEYGRLVAQYFVSPVHLGVIQSQVGETLRVHRGDIKPGDSFIVNHPYRACQNHASDFTLISPVFYGDRLVGYVANVAHKSDIGGGTPGSNPSDATDVLQEGLLLPPLKLYREGELNADLAEMIRANSRTPELTWGDTKAQAMTNVYGANKLVQLMDKFGCDTVLECWEEWAAISEKEMRQRISQIADGVYGPVTGYMDDDGIQLDKPLWIKVTLDKKGDGLHFIFDSIAQNKGPANIRPCLIKAIADYCVKAALGPDLPNNYGCLRPISVAVPPEGHMINPRYPAPVNLYAIECGRISPIVMQVLAQAVPDKVAAPASGATGNIILAGPNPRTGRWYNEYELVAGGYGARPNKDGVSCMDADMANNLNTPIEALETEFPLMIERYELVTDSGGPGRFRGGLGIIRHWKMLADNVILNLRTDAFKFPSPGVFGAKPAKPSRMALNPGTPQEEPLRSKLRGFELHYGDVIGWETGGGGGYGSPLEREIERVVEDVRDGYVSIENAVSDYGVVIDPARLTVDLEATGGMRAGG